LTRVSLISFSCKKFLEDGSTSQLYTTAFGNKIENFAKELWGLELAIPFLVNTIFSHVLSFPFPISAVEKEVCRFFVT
jgi:hypothetical protein